MSNVASELKYTRYKWKSSENLIYLQGSRRYVADYYFNGGYSKSFHRFKDFFTKEERTKFIREQNKMIKTLGHEVYNSIYSSMEALMK